MPPLPPVVYRWLAIALVSIAGAVFAFIKGMDYQQTKDAAADDQARIAAAAFTHRQAQAMAPIAAQAEVQHEADVSRQPSDEAALARHLAHERLRQCPAAAAGAGVPDVRPGGNGGSAGAGADAGDAGRAQAAAALDAATAHDASAYAECYHAFYSLKATAIAAGADKP